MHSVPRSGSGMNTVSIQLPLSSRISHLWSRRGGLVERDRRWGSRSLGQPFPQRLAQVGHGGEIGDAFVVSTS